MKGNTTTSFIISEFEVISNDDANKLINNAANKSCELTIPTNLVKLFVRNFGVEMDSELSMSEQVHKICQE